MFLALAVTYFWYGQDSQLVLAWNILTHDKRILADMVMFCLCWSASQILISMIIKEFGSLVWVTVNVSRLLFSVLQSIYKFGHSVENIQWAAITVTFLGMGLDVVMSHRVKNTVETAVEKED